MILGAAASLAISYFQVPQYTATTQLFVSTSGSGSTADVFQGSQFSKERVSSYARLLAGEEVARRVIDQLDLPLSPNELTDQVAAKAVTDTVLIDVSVTDSSPERAASIAAALGDEFTELVEELEAPTGEDVSPVKVTVTDLPEVPVSPSSPQLVRNAVLGAIGGLLAGVGLAILRYRSDRSVRTPEETQALTGSPVIGTVLRNDSLNTEHVFSRLADGRTGEDYRQLRTNLQFLRVDEPPRTIMVASALPSEGKTTLVVNLALALAQAGQRVVIVEADLRKPKATRYLGLVSGVGLTNVLAGTAALEDALQSYGDGVAVLAAGPTPPNPGELLASAHMVELLSKLRSRSDYVLLDVPPLLPVADSAGLAAAADGVLISVRHGYVRREQLHQAALTLERVGARVLGSVLNVVPVKDAMALGSEYGYAYEPLREDLPTHRRKPSLRRRRS